MVRIVVRIPLHEPQSVILNIVLNLVVLVGICVLGVLILDGAEPEYEKITSYGCTVIQTQDFNGYWQVRVWADYQTEKKPPARHDFETLFSVREKRKQALKDCDKWMSDTHKHIHTN